MTAYQDKEIPFPVNDLNNIESYQNQNQDESDQHQMILTIDVGNNKIEQMKLYDLLNPHKDIYEFCMLHKLSYYNMEEITKQTLEVINEKRRELAQNQMDFSEQNGLASSIYEEFQNNNSNNNFVPLTNQHQHSEELIQQQHYYPQEIENLYNNNINYKNSLHKSPLMVPLEEDEETKIKSFGRIGSGLGNYNPIQSKISSQSNKSIIHNKQPIYSNKYIHQKQKSGNNSGLFPYQIGNQSYTNNKHQNAYNNSLSTQSKPLTLNVSKRSFQSKPSFRKHIPPSSLSNKQKSINNKLEDNFHNSSSSRPSSITINELLQNQILKTDSNRYIFTKNKPSFKSPSVNKTVAKTKSINPIKPTEHVKKHISKKKNINNTINIYERNLKFKEDTKKRIDSLRDTLNQSDDEIYTFQPKINTISTKVLSKRAQNKIECNNPEVIGNYKKYCENKLEEFKQKQSYGNSTDGIEYCTFKPEINAKSQTIDNKKRKYYNVIISHPNSTTLQRDETPIQTEVNSNNYRFEKLYLDSFVQKQHLQLKEKQLQKEYTYNPSFMNDNSNIKTSFNDRLKQYHSKSKEKLIKIKKDIKEEQKNNNTFRPNACFNKNRSQSRKTIRSAVTSHSNTRNNDVFSNLYLYNQLYSQKKDNKYQQAYNDVKIESNTKNINQSSNKLIVNKKITIFKKIFSLLDCDGDGLINSITMKVKNIPDNIKNILIPITDWLQNENETINEMDFISIMEQYYNHLSLDKKREILLMNTDNKPTSKKTHSSSRSNYNSNILKVSLSGQSNRIHKRKIKKSQNKSGGMFYSKDMSEFSHFSGREHK